jgi:hypothetical protein
MFLTIGRKVLGVGKVNRCKNKKRIYETSEPRKTPKKSNVGDREAGGPRDWMKDWNNGVGFYSGEVR